MTHFPKKIMAIRSPVIRYIQTNKKRCCTNVQKKITSNFGENRLGNKRNNHSINRIGWKLPTPIINAASGWFSLLLPLIQCLPLYFCFCFSLSIAFTTDISVNSYVNHSTYFRLCMILGNVATHIEKWMYICYWLAGWLAGQRCYRSTLITRN